MIKGFLLTLVVCVFATVNSQVTMTIVDRSSAIIDSIIIKGTTSFTLGPVNKGSNKTFFVSVNQANFHTIAPFDIHVYSVALNTTMRWQKNGFVDTIYFFNHGLSLVDNEPPRPKIFQVYFENVSAAKPSPVFASDNAITNITELTPRSFVLTLDPGKVGLAQTVSFKLGQKAFTVNLKACNINDWNNSSGSVYLEGDSLFAGFKRSLGPFEFVIDFDLQEELSAKDVQVSASNLLKAYVRNNGRLISAVFDYPSFKANPHFEVKVGHKTYRVKIKAADISETEYQEFFVSKNEVYRLIR